MDIKLFLEYLPWLRQPKYLITQLGLEEDYNEWEIKQTTPVKRSQALQLTDAPDCIQLLYGENDLRHLHFIGGINFWQEPKKLDQGWGFADLSEVNFVVGLSGKIEAYLAYPIRAIPGATDCLGISACDLSSWLEALFCAGFNQRTFLRGFHDEDPVRFKKTILVAKQCALIAGGYEYYDFWAGLLGLPHTDTIPES